MQIFLNFISYSNSVWYFYHIFTIKIKYLSAPQIYGMNVVKADKKYAYVPLPREFYDEIERLIKSRELGYISVSDFVRDAVREKIFEVRTLKERGVSQ